MRKVELIISQQYRKGPAEWKTSPCLQAPALIGIEVKSKDDFSVLIQRIDGHKLNYTLVNRNENLFEYLV